MMKSNLLILIFAFMSLRIIGQPSAIVEVRMKDLPVDLCDALFLLDKILNTKEKQLFLNPERKIIIDSLNDNDIGENLRIQWNLYDTSGFAKYFYNSIGICDPWFISYILLNLYYEKTNNLKQDVKSIVDDFFNNPNKYRKYKLPLYKPSNKINDTIDFSCRYYEFPYSDFGITNYKVFAIIQDYDYVFYRIKIKVIGIESKLRTPKILARHKPGNIYWQNIICLYYDSHSYF